MHIRLLLKNKNTFLLLFLLLLFNTVCFTSLYSQTNTYSGAGSNWNTPSNWSLGIVPTAVHDVVIPDNKTVTVNTAIATCKTLTINTGGNNSNVTVGANTLTVLGAITINEPTANSKTKLIAVTSGVLNAASITMSSTTANNRDCRITLLAGTITVSGNITMNGLALRNQLRINGTSLAGGTLNIGGAILGGDILSSNNNATVNFNGTAAQIIPINADYIYNKIVVNNTIGTTLQAAITSTNVTDNITVQTGILNNGGFAILGNASKIFTVSNSARFQVAGATTAFPSGFGTNSIGTTSTIEYKGTGVQPVFDIPSPGYGNLIFNGTGSWAVVSDIDVANALTVSNGALSTSGILTVAGNEAVTVGATATLTFQNKASLIQSGYTGTNTGNCTYKRTTPSIINTDYTYWSSPVSGYILGNVSPSTLSGKLYSYDAAAIPEDWKQESSGTSMTVGKGYIIRGPESYTTAMTYQASFVGIPNNGTKTITIVGGETSNLIGNPYPSALDASLFLAANTSVIDGTLYFWTHNTGFSNGKYTSDDYASYNGTGGSAASGGIIPTGKIAAGQSFFTTSTTAGGTATFNNTMRVGGTVSNNSQFFKTCKSKVKSESIIEKNRIWLNLSNSQGAFKQMLLGYITGATNEIDNAFDGESFDGNEFVDFYSVNQDKNLVIQGRALPFDEKDEVALGFRTTINGAFTIKMDQVDGLFTNQNVFIEDKLNNTVFDLKSGDYTFSTVAGIFNDRFVLRYTNKTLGTNEYDFLENQVLVSNKNKQIKITSLVELMDKVLVYDLLGRPLYQKDKVNNTELSLPNLGSNQTLLLKITLQNGKTVSKKVSN